MEKMIAKIPPTMSNGCTHAVSLIQRPILAKNLPIALKMIIFAPPTIT